MRIFKRRVQDQNLCISSLIMQASTLHYTHEFNLLENSITFPTVHGQDLSLNGFFVFSSFWCVLRSSRISVLLFFFFISVLSRGPVLSFSRSLLFLSLSLALWSLVHTHIKIKKTGEFSYIYRHLKNMAKSSPKVLMEILQASIQQIKILPQQQSLSEKLSETGLMSLVHMLKQFASYVTHTHTKAGSRIRKGYGCLFRGWRGGEGVGETEKLTPRGKNLFPLLLFFFFFEESHPGERFRIRSWKNPQAVLSLADALRWHDS